MEAPWMGIPWKFGPFHESKWFRSGLGWRGTSWAAFHLLVERSLEICSRANAWVRNPPGSVRVILKKALLHETISLTCALWIPCEVVGIESLKAYCIESLLGRDCYEVTIAHLSCVTVLSLVWIDIVYILRVRGSSPCLVGRGAPCKLTHAWSGDGVECRSFGKIGIRSL